MNTNSPSPPSGDRLQWLETFVRIVEAGSLSAAAAQTHTTQPTVSRRLQALEQSLGSRLLQRSTHVMRLTQDGERCYARAKELLAIWSAFENDLRGAEQAPQGTLRVLVPHAFGQERFVGPLAAFLRAHPGVTVEWLLRDDTRDLIGTGVDCAIQVGEPTDPAVVAIKLGEVPRIAVAAPSVVGDRPVPQAADALATLPWLALRTYYRNEVVLTHQESGRVQRLNIEPQFSTDSLFALRSAALLGLGVAIGSSWVLAEDIAAGRLVHLAPAWSAAPLPLYISYPHARFYSSRLTQFVAMMRETLPASLSEPRPPAQPGL